MQPGEGAPAHCGETWLALAVAARTGLSWRCPAPPCGETGFPGETSVQCLSLRFCRVSDPRLCLWAWRWWGFRPWMFLGVT